MTDENPFKDNPFSENPYEASKVPSREPRAPSEKEDVSALDAIVPTNPLAAIACYCGIFSMLFFCGIGILLGPIAIGMGIMGLKVRMNHESKYGATTSKIRAWIGIVAGALGMLISIVFIAWVLLQS